MGFIKLVIEISVMWSIATINEDLSYARLRHALFDPVNSGGARAEDFTMIMLAREATVGFNIVQGSLVFGGFRVPQDMPKILHSLRAKTLRGSGGFDGSPKGVTMES